VNKFLPYILTLVLSAAIITLFVTGKKKKNRKLNERITLRRQDKLPYGTYVAYRNLSQLFPGASVIVNKNEPGYWDSLSNYEANQALIIITNSFRPDKDELKRLVSFMENGNDVFVSARYVSAATDDLLECSSSAYDFYLYSVDELDKDISLSLSESAFGKKSVYRYPGRTFNSYFTSIDTTTTDILGHDENGKPNFIHLRAGKGNLYVHLEPLAFSNYFILHKDNIGYYEKVMSLIRPGVTKLAWDEYYLKKRNYDDPPAKSKSWFSVLMNMENDNGKKPFRAAFWLSIGLLVVYVLMEMRRRQRYIPVVLKPRNDSLDFVKTIGRLYYDKGDHKNLCHKMGAYFLEHVRNKYKLPTGTLDEAFIKNLQYKSGAGESEIREIVSFIKYSEDAPFLDPAAVKDFHKKLESFYSKA